MAKTYSDECCEPQQEWAHELYWDYCEEGDGTQSGSADYSRSE